LGKKFGKPYGGGGVDSHCRLLDVMYHLLAAGI